MISQNYFGASIKYGAPKGNIFQSTRKLTEWRLLQLSHDSPSGTVVLPPHLLPLVWIDHVSSIYFGLAAPNRSQNYSKSNYQSIFEDRLPLAP